MPGSWLRLPHRTARLRLTLLYGGLFLLAGTVVIVTTYALFRAGGTIATSVRAVPNPSRNSHTVSRFVVPAVVQHNADTARLLALSWLALVLTTFASAPLGWFAAGRVLRPLRAITDAARTMSAGNLHERLALAGPDDEFKQLGDTLDDLLGRLEAAFEAQRRFVANASHELRTPMTLERTLLQIALADPNATAQSLRATCQELLAAGAEQERLLESLLTLATSESGLDYREPIDLEQVADHVLNAHQSEFENLSLTVARELASAPITGDPALIERLIANLIDNAAHHNHPSGLIEVNTKTEGDRAVLTVANSGREISAARVDRLMEPFQRLASGRSTATDGHHGLGLSIVRAIAVAHEANLTVRPRQGGGLAVTVAFQARVAGHAG